MKTILLVGVIVALAAAIHAVTKDLPSDYEMRAGYADAQQEAVRQHNDDISKYPIWRK